MPLTLLEIAEKDPDIEIYCSACGRRLGRYVASADDGLRLDEPGLRGPPDGKGFRTGASSFEVVDGSFWATNRHMKLRWRCGCGARPLWRIERLGRQEVDGHFEIPRVYV